MEKAIELKILILLAGLIISSPSNALQSESLNNAFANEKIESNFVKFTAVEITNDFQKAILEYNKNRENQDSLKGKKKLPEIIKSDGFYTLQDGPKKIQFSIDLILKGEFYFNGKIYSSDQASEKYNPKLFSSYFHKIIDFLISQSIAGEEFVASSDSTRLLIAGIIALDGTFEKIGFTCVLNCKEKRSKINGDKLIKRIKEYKEECEQNLEYQEQSFNRYQGSKDIVDLLLSLNSEFKKTVDLLSQMSAVQKKGNDKKIISNSFEQDMSQRTCFDQIRSTYKMWITNVRATSIERSDLDQQAQSTCEAINGLKSCLSNFHGQSTMIYNSTNRQYKEQMKRDETRVPVVQGIQK